MAEGVPTEELATAGSVTVELAVTEEEWLLGVERLVVSFVGTAALEARFPNAAWGRRLGARRGVPLRIDVPITPVAPQPVRQVVLVPPGTDGRPAARRITDALLHTPASAGAAVLVGDVAPRRGDEPIPAVVAELLRILDDLRRRPALERLVLVARDDAEAREIRRGCSRAERAPRGSRAGNEVSLTGGGWDLARLAAGVRPEADTTPADIVLAALIRSDRLPGAVSSSLVHALSSPLDERLEAALGGRRWNGVVPASEEQAAADPGLTDLLLDTTVLAREVGTRGVRGRHLVATALLEGPLPTRVLEALGVSEEQLLDHFRHAAMAEDGVVWERVLGSVAFAGPFASDRVPSVRDPGPPLADHLGVDVYVAMLATLVARRSTAMPVSIGLFGAWGSGKSHFMELMRARVRDLARSGSADYHEQVLQLTFNAWHYADTNLWASLANEFFAQLARPDVDPIPERRRRVAEQRRETQVLVEEARAARALAATRSVEYAAALERAVARRARASGDLTRRIVGRAWQSVVDEDAARVEQARRRLGVPDTEAVLDVARGVRAAADDVAAVRRLLDRRATLLAFGFLVIGLAFVAAALALPEDAVRWLRGLAGFSLTAAVATAGAAVRGARTWTARLRRLAERADRAAANAVADHPDVVVAREAVARAEADEAVARACAEDAAGVLAGLDRELADLAPDQRLARFVAERAASEDYRGRLGVTSLVRRDFEQLVALMDDWRRSGESAGAPTPIDRIVLYIDDLDRCEPDQVVAVLQAVHLLLAMDLFVVVVGVDPRWLHSALVAQYPAQLGEDTGATPQNFLEKIFQVPFTLPSMADGDLVRLVRHLAGAAPSPGTTAATLPAGPSAGPAAAVERPVEARDTSPDGGASRPLGPITAERGSEVSSAVSGMRHASARGIDDVEVRLLGAADRLVATPRGATRLLNLYGLLRSTRDLHPGAGFLPRAGGAAAFEAVVTLLAVLVGSPRLFGPLLDGLSGSAAPGWAEFRRSLAPCRDDDGRWGNSVRPAMTGAERAEWARLVSGLDALAPLTRLDDLDVFREWAPRVARFSFSLAERDADA